MARVFAGAAASAFFAADRAAVSDDAVLSALSAATTPDEHPKLAPNDDLWLLHATAENGVSGAHPLLRLGDARLDAQDERRPGAALVDALPTRLPPPPSLLRDRPREADAHPLLLLQGDSARRTPRTRTQRARPAAHARAALAPARAAVSAALHAALVPRAPRAADPARSAPRLRPWLAATALLACTRAGALHFAVAHAARRRAAHACARMLPRTRRPHTYNHDHIPLTSVSASS